MKEEAVYIKRNCISLHISSKPLVLLKMVNPFVLSAKERPICLEEIANDYNGPKPLPQGMAVVNKKNGTSSLTHVSNITHIIDFQDFRDSIKDEIEQA